jgi:hypothetical protein
VKHSIWGLILLLFIVGAAIGFSLSSRDGDNAGVTPSPDGIVCTQEARACPDGSFVGRTGPKCEFAPCPNTRRISLYYYDATRDTDDRGNILCSSRGLVMATRDIAVTQTPIQDAVRLLSQGALTADEKARGITTEYPLSGLSLTGASLRDGVLTLAFNDPENRTTGGSCRVAILRSQIEATVRQFDGVREVRFIPDSLFQP